MTYYKDIIKGVDNIGDLTTLKTKNKDNIVKAVNELSTNLSKSENTKYSTVNGVKEFICEQDGYIDNIHIEGETLLNMCIPINGVQFWDENRLAMDLFKNTNQWYSENKLYTVVNLSNKKIGIDYGTKGVWSFTRGGHTVEPGKSELVTVNVNECISNIFGLISNGWENTASSKDEFKCSVIILEGDYTKRNIRYYFEGLRSASDIEIITHDDIVDIVTINESSCVSGKYMDANGELKESTNYWCVTDFIEIKGDFVDFGIYSKPIDYWSTCYYDKDKKFIANLRGGIGNSFNNNIPKGAKYLRTSIIKGFNSTNIKFCNRIDDKQILTTLRSLPNGTKDIIFKQGNNKYFKLKRCEEVLLNGDLNEEWISHHILDLDKTKVFACKATRLNDRNSIKILSDRFLCVATNDNFGTNDIECMTNGQNNSYQLMIRIDKTRLTTQDVDGFKTWLRANPIKVIYELETPVLEEIPNFNPQTFNNKTTLIVNAGCILLNADFEVNSSLSDNINILKDKTRNSDKILFDEISSIKSNIMEYNTVVQYKSLKDIPLKPGRYMVAGADETFPTAYGNLTVDYGSYIGEFICTFRGMVVGTDIPPMWISINRYGDINDRGWKPWQKVTTSATLSLMEQQISELELQLMENEVL